MKKQIFTILLSLLVGGAALLQSTGCSSPPGKPGNPSNDVAKLCGNKTKDAGEKCDTAATGTDKCPTAAECTAMGKTLSGTGCQAECVDGSSSTCGNTTKDAGEKCDTAATGADKCPTAAECTAMGKTLSGTGCQAECVDGSSTTCGNTTKDAGEKCDTNATGADKCPTEAECTAMGKVLSGTGCQAECLTAAEACGNGIKDPGETCDTAATGDDACPTATQCSSEGKVLFGSDCQAACSLCGNGNVDPGETCDKGLSPANPKHCLYDSECRDKTRGDQSHTWTYRGDVADCSATCTREAQKICDSTTGDGVCPSGCDESNDIDCAYGKDCSTDTDCTSTVLGTRGQCLNAKSGHGVCTMNRCENVAECPVGSDCLKIGNDPYKTCYKTCKTDISTSCNSYSSKFSCVPLNGSSTSGVCLYVPNAVVGESCTDANEATNCHADGVCLTNVPDYSTPFPGGYCSSDCDGLLCPGRSACTTLGSVDRCIQLCADSGDCRDTVNYDCKDFRTTTGTLQSGCFPLPKKCLNSTKCTSPETCVDNVVPGHPSRKICAEVGSGSGEILSSCTRVSDCAGQQKAVCQDFSKDSTPKKVCSKSCTKDSDCGGTNKCLPLNPRPAGKPEGPKYCTKSCNDDSECDTATTGLSCVNNACVGGEYKGIYEGEVGAPCVSSKDCGVGYTCFTPLDHSFAPASGFCTKMCNNVSKCTEGDCVELFGLDVCLPSCDSDEACMRAGESSPALKCNSARDNHCDAR